MTAPTLEELKPPEAAVPGPQAPEKKKSRTRYLIFESVETSEGLPGWQIVGTVETSSGYSRAAVKWTEGEGVTYDPEKEYAIVPLWNWHPGRIVPPPPVPRGTVFVESDPEEE